MIQANNLVLFQGDSITDAGRVRDAAAPNDTAGLGRGYALLAAAHQLATRPADGLRFRNLGISGNRVVDLFARWREDCLNLRPDIVSILIGVNDTWHEFGRGAGVPLAKYERVYRELLEETREALPEVRLVLCEPFVLRCGVVTAEWIDDINGRRAIVRRLAEASGAVLVEFQAMFDAAVEEAPPEYWAGDGVHPSLAGHLRMARAWLQTVAG